MHEGTYADRGPVVVSSSTLAVRGGFRYAAGSWSDAGGSTTIAINIADRTGAATCTTDSFNSTGRPLVAALQASDGSQLALFNLEITATGGGASDCAAVLHGTDSTLRLDGVTVFMRGSPTSACSAGVSAAGASRVEIESSIVFGVRFTGIALPANLDAAGVAGCDGPSVHLSRSTIAAVDAPALTTVTRVGALVALAARGAADVYVQRSRLESVLNQYDWDASEGRLGGLQVTATGRLFMANSVVRTPHGGTLNRAIEVGGPPAGFLGALQLYHVTAAVGDDWGVTRTVPAAYRAAALYLTGDVRDVSLYNNMLLLAGGAAIDVNFTGIDRFETTADPVNLQVAGNIVSVPFTSPFHLATLMQCAATAEFASWFDEMSLNTARAHECHGGGRDSWVAAGNRAFTVPPGSDIRVVVELEADGYPTLPARVYLGTSPPLPLMSEVSTDFADLPRRSPVGAGAWAQRL